MQKNWRTIEAKKSEIINNWKNKRLKERNLKNIIFLHQDLFVQKKKSRKRRDGLMHQMSRGRDQWQLNAACDRQRMWKKQEGFVARTSFFILEEIQMIIFEQFLFTICQKSICLRIVSGGNNKKKLKIHRTIEKWKRVIKKMKKKIKKETEEV